MSSIMRVCCGQSMWAAVDTCQKSPGFSGAEIVLPLAPGYLERDFRS
jgi:hypothetical protein